MALAACEPGGVRPGSKAANTFSDAPASAASTPAAAPAAAPAASGLLVAPTPVPPRPTEAQRQAGATLAAQGAGAVVACASCHGAQGEGNAAGGFPRIAGQSAAYLLHQLASYADGHRNHPVMGPIAKAMSEAQRQQAAAYYASLAPAAAASAAAAAPPASSASRGRELALRGDEAQAVQACANCHGAEGVGLGATYPYLAGQHAGYLASALGAWRDGSRRNDYSGQMILIGKSLNAADAQAVAAYYAQLPPPARPRDADEAAPAAQASARPAVVSGPTAPGTAPQGVGTDQGAATTGGAQGPGGGGGGSGGGSSGSPHGQSTPLRAPQAASGGR